MRHRVLDDRVGCRTVAVALEIGDQAVASLVALATELDLGASVVSGIGGFQRAQLAYFDVDGARFVENALDEQVEVLSFLGNLSREEAGGAQHLHAHVVLGRADSTTRGGHLVEATVRPTLEVLIVETPGRLVRGVDPRTGLVVLKP